MVSVVENISKPQSSSSDSSRSSTRSSPPSANFIRSVEDSGRGALEAVSLPSSSEIMKKQFEFKKKNAVKIQKKKKKRPCVL